MKKCPSCGTINDDVSKFCKNCGQILPSKNICPYCKSQIDPNDTFCKHCGKSLKGIPVSIKRKTSKSLKIALITVGSLIGIIAVAYLGLFLFVKYYLPKRYIPATDYNAVELEEEQGLAEPIESLEPAFGELIISSSIDNDTYKPIDPADEFDIGFRQIYAAIEVSGVTPDDTFTYMWKYAGSGEVISEFSFNYFKPQGYIPDYIALSEDDNIDDYALFSEPGDYLVEFYHNGELIDSETFGVNPDGPVFEELIVCSKIDQNSSAPEGEIGEFDIGIKNIFATIYLTGATADDSWRFIFREADDIIKEYTANYNSDNGDYFEGYQAICLTVPQEESIKGIRMFGQPSTYTVDFYHNGNLIDSCDFSIKPTEIKFGSFEFYEGIEENEDGIVPVGSKQEFEYGIEVVIAAVEICGWVDRDDYYYFIWKNKETGEIIQVKSNETGEPVDYDILTLDEGYYDLAYCRNGQQVPEGISFKDTIIFGNPGTYMVEFYYNGGLMLDNEFTILEP